MQHEIRARRQDSEQNAFMKFCAVTSRCLAKLTFSSSGAGGTKLSRRFLISAASSSEEYNTCAMLGERRTSKNKFLAISFTSAPCEQTPTHPFRQPVRQSGIHRSSMLRLCTRRLSRLPKHIRFATPPKAIGQERLRGKLVFTHAGGLSDH